MQHRTYSPQRWWLEASLVLSGSQYALLDGVVRHTALVVVNNRFKVTSVQVPAFPQYPQLRIPVGSPYR